MRRKRRISEKCERFDQDPYVFRTCYPSGLANYSFGGREPVYPVLQSHFVALKVYNRFSETKELIDICIV